MPGHKRHAFGYLPAEFSSIDFTEVSGLDDLHDPSGIILDAQKNTASVLGADESFFLVNGSTAGILAAVSACTEKGGKILICRNCHRSAYNAIYLRGLTPVYIFPKVMEMPCINDAVNAEDVRKALDEKNDVQAVLIVSPTYEGRLADIEEIAEAVHEKGIPLIVDEAHGAHLSFMEESRSDAIRCGADIAIQSVHKTLPAPTQTSVLSVKGSLVNRDKLRRFLSIYQSSSPSYPLMSMIDGCIRYMDENSGELIPAFRDNFENLLKHLEVCDKLIFRPSVEELRSGKADYGKLLICTGELGVSGAEAAGILRDKYGIETEMACPGYVLAMFTVCDDEAGYDRVVEALISLDRSFADIDVCHDSRAGAEVPDIEAVGGGTLFGKTGNKTSDAEYLPAPVTKMSISDAVDSEREYIPPEESAGRICTDIISMYPPGTPILAPGEEITEAHRDYLLRCISKGYNIKGIGDEGISVVKNG